MNFLDRNVFVTFFYGSILCLVCKSNVKVGSLQYNSTAFTDLDFCMISYVLVGEGVSCDHLILMI